VSYLLLCLLTLGGLACYVMEPWERAQAVRALVARFRGAQDGARRLRRGREPLDDLLRARTPYALVTPALAAINLGVFAGLAAAGAGAADPAALVGWGASYGPLTTNGEWWRLVTATFVHGGLLHLAVNLSALLSVGLVLERLVGHLTFAAVYLAAAIVAGLAELSGSAVTVAAGGSAAILGLYGLLLASWMWGVVQHAASTIRLRTVTRLVPAAVLFGAYHAAARGGFSAGEHAGLATGFLCGIALARCVRETTPPLRRVAATVAASLSFAILMAAPLRGVVDINPELDRLVVIEEQHARAYDEAASGFSQGRIPRADLLALIEETILPELEGPRARLAGLTRIPPEQRPLLAAAEAYLRRRDESWRLRAAALLRSSSAGLREADAAERAALDSLRSLRQ
jgi:rhomboid protease GluP